MKIASLNKLTLLDFPGVVSAIIFTQGCDLRCPFCQNSTLIGKSGKEKISEEEVLKYLERRKKILDGVSISGGEPLLQDDLVEFLTKVKSFGYKVKLDTNGNNPERLANILDLGLVDYVALDVKAPVQKYANLVGKKDADISKVKQSIDILKKSEIDYEFRTTIIKEFHTISDIKEIIKLIGKDQKYFIQNFEDSENVLVKGLHGFTRDELIEFSSLTVEYPNLIVRGL